MINGITVFRIGAFPFLLLLLYYGRYDWFKWLLGLCFFTDFIDGFLARKYQVASILGTRLDSIGDDLTVLAGVIGLFVIHPSFIKEQQPIFIILLVLFGCQTSYAFARYGKMTNFHTYLAKTAAILQGIFLLVTFFMGTPSLILFYTATMITMLELIEEIIMVRMLPAWKANVKGIYEILNKKNQEGTGESKDRV